jgi:hypothetical protein
MRLQRRVLQAAAGIFILTLLFPPIVVINDKKSAEVHYCFLLMLPPLNPGVTLWPLTAFLLFLEWILIVGVTGGVYWIAGRTKTSE